MSNRILHIIPSLSRGGAEVLLCSTIELLPEYEHKIVLLEKTQNRLSCNADITCLEANMPEDVLSLRKKLNTIIAEFKPSLINAHLYWAVILIRLCKTNSIPVLQWYHSDLYNKLNKEQYSLKRLILDKITYKKRHFLVFVSRYLKEQIIIKLGAKDNYFVLYNFVGKQFYNIPPLKPKPSNKPLKILVVGNLRQQKNHLTLLRAIALLPPYEFETTIIGTGPMMAELEKFVRDQNLKNVNLIGSQDNVTHHLFDTDLFVMPSLFEGFGISLLEAMAASRPCIVSDIPVFREVGEDSLVYFNPTDYKELSVKILAFKDYHLRYEYGQKVHQRASLFTAEKYSNKLRHMYKQVILQDH